ncbi:MFS transporter TsgA [Photobacterium angustum]|uniref:MFS transporter TsgA n=1 Tax=Photobacterium angustum TaxID=661 RepID=A0A855SEM4_PHOAN|nr:MFS transporter TsgA [Photobacterium angustum]KJF81011.1 transporter [Photobacterium damselae subsp. damselae]KJG33309.1 transporter [Photobacterium angustum]KJG41605.1 transporter [Photobacterium angustum]KJG44491.1 transporter [Photobacterium angustum]KJG49533.1 transporter [Photobacterium angustum]
MTKTNRNLLTWISFLSYALTGSLIIVTGIVMGDIAKYFSLPISSMSNTFTFLNTGILISIFLNVWLMEIVPLKRQLIFGFCLMVLAILGLMLGHNLAVFSGCMFVLGVVSGITMSIGTYLITHIYEGKQRGSRLLFTDSFFSMAGMIFPIISAAVLAHHLQWYWVYVAIGIIYLAIFVLTLFAQFPVLGKKDEEEFEVIPEKEKWGLGVVFLAIAALCYILGQLGFVSWIPEYATKQLGMSITDAGHLVSYFWGAYMVGMWIFSAILKKFDLQRLVMVLSALATVLMYWFNKDTDAKTLLYVISILGFFSSAIYTSIITLGSQQTKASSPKLVNFILLCGTIGTMLTFVVTSPIVESFDPHAALVTANGLYAVVFLMCFLVGFVTKHRIHGHADAA